MLLSMYYAFYLCYLNEIAWMQQCGSSRLQETATDCSVEHVRVKIQLNRVGRWETVEAFVTALTVQLPTDDFASQSINQD